MPAEDFIINAYCLIDHLFKELFPNPIRNRDYEPKLSDSKILSTHTATGSMDTSAYPLLFYKAMAQAENPLSKFDQVRRRSYQSRFDLSQ